MILFQEEVLIRETHADIFAHVNNAVYLRIFEEVRWDYLASQGLTMVQMQASQTGPVILECQIKFLKELHVRETVMVTFEPIDYQGRVGHLLQRMIKADNTVACEAVFTYGLFDLQARKLLVPSELWKKALGL